MDLKVDFSELINNIRDLIRDHNPIVRIEVISKDGSKSFQKMEIRSTMIPLVGDVFQPDNNSYYDEETCKVKVLEREIYYYGSEINTVTLTVEVMK